MFVMNIQLRIEMNLMLLSFGVNIWSFDFPNLSNELIWK